MYSYRKDNLDHLVLDSAIAADWVMLQALLQGSQATLANWIAGQTLHELRSGTTFVMQIRNALRKWQGANCTVSYKISTANLAPNVFVKTSSNTNVVVATAGDQYTGISLNAPLAGEEVAILRVGRWFVSQGVAATAGALAASDATGFCVDAVATDWYSGDIDTSGISLGTPIASLYSLVVVATPVLLAPVIP